MRKRSLGATLVAVALSVLLLMPTASGGALPKVGKYVGKTKASEKKIVMNVKEDRKATVKFCGYAMGTTVKDSGKFTAKHVGPGGTYVAVKGEFVTRRKATGKVTIDFLCGTEGEAFTLRRT
jgi:hypothetical protein